MSRIFFCGWGGVLPLLLSLCSDRSNVVRPLKHILQMPFQTGAKYCLRLEIDTLGVAEYDLIDSLGGSTGVNGERGGKMGGASRHI